MEMFLNTVVMFIIALFAIFRVSEIKWRDTFWADTIGYLCLGIAAFWKAVLYSHVLFDSGRYGNIPDAFPTAVLYIGICLILFSATCFRRRRRSDPRRELRLNHLDKARPEA